MENLPPGQKVSQVINPSDVTILTIMRNWKKKSSVMFFQGRTCIYPWFNQKNVTFWNAHYKNNIAKWYGKIIIFSNFILTCHYKIKFYVVWHLWKTCTPSFINSVTLEWTSTSGDCLGHLEKLPNEIRSNTYSKQNPSNLSFSHFWSSSRQTSALYSRLSWKFKTTSFASSSMVI